MNQISHAPHRLFRLGAAAIGTVWWLLVAAFAISVLAWVVLHGWIVPRIEQYRPALEAQASLAVGAPVRIGEIQARSTGWIPSFELHGVRLLDAQGRDALLLPRVVIAVSPRSLWGMGFEQLYIDKPELDIRRMKDGRITIAGLDLSAGKTADSNAGLDWFFSQAEFAIQGGSVRWTDEQRGGATVALSGVDFVVRNRSRRHALRLHATPPPEWGTAFQVSALFRQPVWASGSRWQDWMGEVHADFSNVDISQLQRFVTPGVDLTEGHGALRAWAAVRQGQITEVTADVALAGVQLRLRPELEVLGLRNMTGRLAGKALPGGLEFSTQALQFDTTDGLHWPGGNVFVRHSEPPAVQGGSALAQGELRADRLSLQALSQIASRLPLASTTHALLQAHAPKGLVESLAVTWQGPLQAPAKFTAQGRVADLELQAQAAGVPGVKGLRVDFSATQSGGQATLGIKKGSVELPGVLADPLVEIDELSVNAKWLVNGSKLSAELTQLKFANADAQGEGEVRWRTSDPAVSSSASRFPGIIDAQVQLSRGIGNRVHYYLPTTVSQEARDYVRGAIGQGDLSAVKFVLKGDLNDMPARAGKTAEFRIAARMDNVTYAYSPVALPVAGGAPLVWPALAQLSGELLFNGNQMQIKGASARLAGTAGVQIQRIEAEIADLSKTTVVNVQAEARGPLNEMARALLASPLQPKLAPALGSAALSGPAEYKVQLNLPINTIDKSRVNGTVLLAGNDVQITPQTPAFSQVRGGVQFSENGVALAGVQARAVGGDVRLEGGSRALLGNTAFNGLQPSASSSTMAWGAGASEPSIAFRAQGLASAEGLRAASELGFVSQLASYATGSTPYTAWLAVRQGLTEYSVATSLQGMALGLPAPLAKTAESVLPVRLDNVLLRESLAPDTAGTVRPQDLLALELGAVAALSYVRDISGPQPRVLRGQIAVGLQPGESPGPAAQGVVANVRLQKIDADAWSAVLARLGDASVREAAALTQSTVRLPPGGVGPATAAVSVAPDYLPTRLAVRAAELTLDGRKLSNMVLGGSREGTTWRANIDASELSGYLEYRQPAASGAGRVYARLARLTVASSTAADVEDLLEQQPASIPALDIVVEDFELRGRKLGRIEIDAVNRGGRTAGRDPTAPDTVREWRLNKFNLTLPEARLTASGNWAVRGAQAAPGDGASPAPAAQGDKRRTVMNFTLDIADSGKLLARFGMNDLIRGGAGKMQGQIGWLGSPLALDYPSLTGQFNVSVNAGQFLQADPGLAKLLGVLSLQSLPRRLTLDFRDVFSEGFAFDFVRGDVLIDRGLASTNNLQMKGVNAAVLMAGSADIARETQDVRAVVVPELNAGTASLITTIINPAVGLGTFLAQLFFRQPLIEAATQEFQISGSWADPKIVKVDRRARVGAANEPAKAAAEERAVQ